MEIHPTVGSIEETPDGFTIYRAIYGQGYIYKNWEAFIAGDGVCYVPELSDTTYDRDDFLAMCNGQEDIAEGIFDGIDWQHPETYLDEQFREGELDECDSCGKLFWCYGVDRCPYCGKRV